MTFNNLLHLLMGLRQRRVRLVLRAAPDWQERAAMISRWIAETSEQTKEVHDENKRNDQRN